MITFHQFSQTLQTKFVFLTVAHFLTFLHFILRLKALNNLNVHKLHGPDGIPASDCKAPMFALIFNEFLHQGKLPIDWKNAFVVPIFKKGLRTDPTNYRPISLTCICCKVFEHIVVSSISAHANLHNIICKEQHGFQKHYSCET